MSIDPKVFKQVRKRLGMSQAELADALGLSRVTINKMERGRLARGIPDEIGERLVALKPRLPVAAHVSVRDVQAFADADPANVKAISDMEMGGDSHLWDNEEDDQ